ncbi:hypothetical protein DL93DRAFT_2159653 [Clavulina sp. PMI_390]|nr:hypothetical protein DL93DRAFT_2159653 [Clavulina sp. PMI_390]
MSEIHRLASLTAQAAGKLTELVRKEHIRLDNTGSPSTTAYSAVWADGDVGSLHEAITRLSELKRETEHAQLRSRIRAAKTHNARQPIYRLPSEMLLRILEIGVPTAGDAWPLSIEVPPGHEPIEPESWQEWSLDEYESFRAAFSLVCVMFHAVVLRSPRSWSCVKVVLDHDNLIPPNAIGRVLARSAPSMFDLTIDSRAKSFNYRIPFSNYTSVLKSHMARCRSFTLAADFGGINHIEALLGGVQMPNLKHFNVFWGHDEKSSWFYGSIRNILPAGCSFSQYLLSLTICDNFSFYHSKLPITQFASSAPTLTRLRIAGPYDAASVRSFLEGCIALEHLHWRSSCPNSADTPESAALTMPCLRSLTLRGYQATLSFPQLDAPVLEQVILSEWDPKDENKGYDEMQLDCAIFHPAQPQLPSLRRLSFDPSFHRADVVSKILAEQSSLYALVLDHPTLDSISECGLSSILAALETICKWYRRGRTTRSGDVPSLARLHLNLQEAKKSDMMPAVREAIEQLQKAAPNVRISYDPEEEGEGAEPEFMPGLVPLERDDFLQEGWPAAWMECERNPVKPSTTP